MSDFILVDKESELGGFLMSYQAMDKKLQERLLGYMKALGELQ